MRQRYTPNRRLQILGLESLEGRRLLTVNFPTNESYPVDAAATTYAPTGLAVGDFNKDGLPDIAVATNSYIGTVEIFLDNTGGNFVRGTSPTLKGGYPTTGIASADFNGDGNLDLVVSHINNNVSPIATGLTILDGNGDGTFQAASTAIATTDLSSFAVGDFNGDGKPDIATIESTGLNIYLNKGDGTFNAPEVYAAGDQSYIAGVPLRQTLTVGDFDGDGKLDLAEAASDSNGAPILDIFHNAGNGTFASPVAVPGVSPGYELTAQAFAGNGKSPQAVDLNGDSHADLVEVGESSKLGVALNDGSGGLTSLATYAADRANSIAVADFDGDGKQDVAILGSKEISVFPNNGDGTLGTPTKAALPSADTETSLIAVADFDGDGKPDVVVLNNTSGSYSVGFLLSAPAAPRLAPIAAIQNVPYGNSTQITATGSDADPSQTLTYSVSGGFGTIDATTGVYTSPEVTLGMVDQTVTVTASDSHSPPQTTSETFTIHPVYNSPVVVINNKTYYSQDGFADGTLNISVPTGQPVTLAGEVLDSAADQPVAATINLNDFVNTGLTDQSVPINSDGSFSLTHTYVTAGFYQVVMKATDSQGHSTLCFISVTITGSDSGSGGSGSGGSGSGGSGSGGSGSGGSGSGGSGSGGGGTVSTPPVQVSSIQEVVAKRVITEFKVQYGAAVTGADVAGAYHLELVTTKKVKKRIVTTIKSIPIKRVTYNSAINLAEIFTVKKLAPGSINQLTITSSGIQDSLGRELDGNHDDQPGGDLTASVGKTTVNIQ